MNIGGIQKFSLLDYPDKIATIIFTNGCNFRCGYCHNPELVNKPYQNILSQEEIVAFLKKRVGKLEAVSITGGEPLLQKDLLQFLKTVKKLGFFTKIDTNGSFPKRLKTIINSKMIDYVSMDIKTSLKKYQTLIKKQINPNDILESIRIILASEIKHEFRTTLVAGLLSSEDILEIMELIKGANIYYLQRFKKSKHLDVSFLKSETFDENEIRKLLKVDIVKTVCR